MHYVVSNGPIRFSSLIKVPGANIVEAGRRCRKANLSQPPPYSGRQTAAGEHESSIKSNDSITETNGTEQGNENPFPRDFDDSM
jgi:hypothetical protein